MWAYFCWIQRSWVWHLNLKTTPSCPGLIPTPHSTIDLIAGSAEHSPPQLKTSHGGFLRFKERTFFNSVMTSNNSKMNWCNYGHNVTFNFDWVLTWLNDICNCKTGFVSNCLKAFKLQMVAQAPMSATASSNSYLGPLNQRPSIWGLGEYVASTI